MTWGVDEIVLCPDGNVGYDEGFPTGSFLFRGEGKRTKCGLHIPPEGHAAETVWHTPTELEVVRSWRPVAMPRKKTK